MAPTPQEVLQSADQSGNPSAVTPDNPTPAPAAPDVQAPPQSSADLLAGLPSAATQVGPTKPPASTDQAKPDADSPASVPNSFASKLATALKVAHSVLSTGSSILSTGGLPQKPVQPNQADQTGGANPNLQPSINQTIPVKPKGVFGFFATPDELAKRASIAHEQIDTLYQSRMVDKQGEEAEEGNVKMGKTLFDSATTGQYAAPVLKEGITATEAQRLIKQNHLDPTDIHLYPTGIIENADGSKQTTWSVIGDVPAQPMSADAAKLINQYVPNSHPPGQPWSEDKDKPQPPMPGYQLHSLYQQAMSNKTVLDAANNAREESDLKGLTDQQRIDQTKAVSTLNVNNDWMKALNAFNGQEDLAANWISGNGKLPNGQADPSSVQAAKNNPNVMQTIALAHGGAADWSKVVRDAQETRITQQAANVKKMEEIDPLYKIEHDPGEYAGDKGPAAQAQLEGMLNDPKTPANQIGRIQHLLGVVKSSMKTQQTLQEAKAQFDQALKDGDPDSAARLLYGGLIAPSEIISTRNSAFAQQVFQKASDMAKAAGSSWTPAMSQVQFEHAKNAQVQNSLDMIRTINEPGGDMDILKQTAEALPAMNQQTVNKLFNAAETEFGDPSASTYHTALLNLATLAATVQKGGATPDAPLIQDQLNQLKASYSKGQLAKGIQILSNDIAARGRAIIGTNPTLKAAYSDVYQQSAIGGAGKPGATASTITVVDPSGHPWTFNDQASADKFKKSAGIK